jgi:hypothetical protein
MTMITIRSASLGDLRARMAEDHEDLERAVARRLIRAVPGARHCTLTQCEVGAGGVTSYLYALSGRPLSRDNPIRPVLVRGQCTVRAGRNGAPRAELNARRM